MKMQVDLTSTPKPMHTQHETQSVHCRIFFKYALKKVFLSKVQVADLLVSYSSKGSYPGEPQAWDISSSGYIKQPENSDQES